MDTTDTLTGTELGPGPGEGGRIIVMGAIGPDFDPASHLPLGPWCFVGAEDIYPQWTGLPFVRTFERAEKERAAAMTFRLSGHQIVRLGETLNQRHGENHSEHYWRILLTPWILWVVDMTWRAYVHSQKFIGRFGGESLTLPIFDREMTWDFRDYLDFYDRGFTGDAFSAWLYSLILDLLGPETWRRQPMSLPVPPYRSGDAGKHIQSRGKRFMRQRRNFTGKLNFTQVAGIKYEKLLFSALIRLLPRRPAPELYQVPGDYEPASEFPADYLTLLERMTDIMMPGYLRGGYAELAARAAAEKFVPGRLQVGAPDVVNAAERFRIAAAIEGGKKIVVSQHGGGYGTFSMNADAAQSEYVQHYFLSWGWSQQGDYPGNIIPLPSPMLSKIRNRHRPRNRNLILVGTRMTLRSPRLVSAPEPIEWIRYREEKTRFIGALDQPARQALMYRPYFRSETDIEDEAYLRDRIGELPVLEGNLIGAMLDCRLVIVDHPTTTLHEALAANVPTIAFWNDDAWPMCRQAEPIFTAMRDAGMVHADAGAAAKKTNEIWDDVQGWWESGEIQGVRREFCRNHALTSRFWWWDWIKALSRL